MGTANIIDLKRAKKARGATEDITFIIKGGQAMASTGQDQFTVKTAQLENGYAKVANELMEAYCRAPSFPPYIRLHWLVIRLTYGYHRKEATIRLGEIAEACNIRKNHVVREFKKLVSAGIIHSLKEEKRGCYTVWLNKVEERFVKPSTNKDLDKLDIEQGTPREVTTRSGGKSSNPTGLELPPHEVVVTTQSGDTPFKYNLKIKDKRVRESGELPPNQVGRAEGGDSGGTLSFSLSSKPEPIPQDFALTEAMRQYAGNKGMDDVDIDFEFEKFVQYNIGKGDRRRDWIAVWRFWCMRWEELKRKESGDDDGQFERVMRMIEEEERMQAGQ